MRAIPQLLSWFSRIDQELHTLISLDLKSGLSSEFSQFFDNTPARILYDVLFGVFRFSF